MNKRVLYIAAILLIVGFLSFVVAKDAFSITTGAVNNGSKDEIESCISQCPTGCAAPENRICASDGEKYCSTCIIECYGLTVANNSFCSKNKLTKSQITNITHAKNRIKVNATLAECPEKCTCTGSAVKCILANGSREMTITAGKSGNTIIQIKGVNGSTNVTLYKADGKLYGVFKNNTKEVKMLPDQVLYKITEKTAKKFEDEKIELTEDGDYKYQAKEKAKLFFIIPVKVPVDAGIDSGTGKIIRFKKAWWAVFTKEDNSNLIMGNSCGTVTPGYNDDCCQSKGFDVWNEETAECEFSSA